AIGRYGITPKEAGDMTLYEFRLYGLGHAIKQEEERFLTALQSWNNQQVQATKGSGRNTRSAYESFKDFYDKQDNFRQIFMPSKKEQKRVSLA
ncbi:hypothetical protein CVR98_26645, partial [Salmonella enterica subsp. enterica serovar Enteritidis]